MPSDLPRQHNFAVSAASNAALSTVPQLSVNAITEMAGTSTVISRCTRPSATMPAASRASEPPQVIRAQRPSPLRPGNTHSPDAVSARPASSSHAASCGRTCLGPSSRLRVNQGRAVRLDLAPAQAAYLPRPAPGQQEQAHRRNADRPAQLFDDPANASGDDACVSNRRSRGSVPGLERGRRY